MGEVKSGTFYTSSLGCPMVQKAPRFAGTERAHKQRSRDPFFCQDWEERSGLNSRFSAWRVSVIYLAALMQMLTR